MGAESFIQSTMHSIGGEKQLVIFVFVFEIVFVFVFVFALCSAEQREREKRLGSICLGLSLCRPGLH